MIAEEVRRYLAGEPPLIPAEHERGTMSKKAAQAGAASFAPRIVAACRHMNAIGLNQGTSGNISARFGDRMLITPSGVPYDEMAADDIAAMPIEGEYGSWDGPLAPSTEWRFHLDITRARPEVGAIVHAHSTFATALAIARKDDPGLPLHDRGRRRADDPLRALRHLRHQGALGRRAEGAGGPHLPACSPITA